MVSGILFVNIVMIRNGNVEGSIEMTKWETLNKLYLEQGLKIFPVVENGKTPLIKEWQKDCSDKCINYFCQQEIQNKRTSITR